MRTHFASVWAYLSLGPSPYLICVLLVLAGYARVVYLGRSQALREVEAGLGRERVLEADLSAARNEVSRTQAELRQVRESLTITTSKLAEVEAQRTQVNQQLTALQQVVSVQAERLAQRPKAAAKALNVSNGCSAVVRLAVRFRGDDGIWRTYSFWELQPGQHRLRVNSNGKIVEARVTWNLVYVYAEAVDSTWFYRGVDGEIEKVQDGNRTLTMKRLDLPTDGDDTFLLKLCQ